jgi:hypothetical protein
MNNNKVLLQVASSVLQNFGNFEQLFEVRSSSISNMNANTNGEKSHYRTYFITIDWKCLLGTVF